MKCLTDHVFTKLRRSWRILPSSSAVHDQMIQFQILNDGLWCNVNAYRRWRSQNCKWIATFFKAEFSANVLHGANSRTRKLGFSLPAVFCWNLFHLTTVKRILLSSSRTFTEWDSIANPSRCWNWLFALLHKYAFAVANQNSNDIFFDWDTIGSIFS